jgi:chromate transporter
VSHWREIVAAFLRLGATSYGGPAIMGVMQAELQERRQWLSQPRFVEGLALVNMLPGATATQLALFLGYARGGWWGALLGGFCFVLPAFAIMLALTVAYAALGVSPLVRGALYGLGPVVLGIFLVAVYRLGRTAASTWLQALIAVAAAAATLWSPLGVAAILVLAGARGLGLFCSRRLGIAALATAGLAMAALHRWSPAAAVAPVDARAADAPGLAGLATFFLEVGALTVGGGLAMIAFIQARVVEQLYWLTAQEFIDGLALGQFTPGPILMVAAYVGYKVAGVAGAAVAAGAAFLPSFVMMLAILPAFDRVRTYTWTRAVLKGMSPAVIGLLAVSLTRLAPYALVDPLAIAIFLATVAALLLWRPGTVRLMLGGAVLGALRNRWFPLPGIR